jgi:hypothetical protein
MVLNFRSFNFILNHQVFSKYSSMRQLIEKPPIMGKEISNLSAGQMVGFKLAPG